MSTAIDMEYETLCGTPRLVEIFHTGLYKRIQVIAIDIGRAPRPQAKRGDELLGREKLPDARKTISNYRKSIHPAIDEYILRHQPVALRQACEALGISHTSLHWYVKRHRDRYVTTNLRQGKKRWMIIEIAEPTNGTL